VAESVRQGSTTYFIKNVMKPGGPCLLGFNTCRQFIRRVPVLPRDEIDMDDVDSKAEDDVAMRRAIGW
jgi:hypothetical protein